MILDKKTVAVSVCSLSNQSQHHLLIVNYKLLIVNDA